MNYYNEFDKDAAAQLRVLIAEGLISPGIVDERSIEDVRPDELAGYAQCHFFAGIGVWSFALRLAGWPDDKPVWTGSCPCQPFSAAGKGDGFADERHLWPHFYHLISQRRPAIILGEQVAAKAVGPWIDLVHADLEGVGYAFGCVPFPSAGVGAPHIRDRTYWVADANSGAERHEHFCRDLDEVVGEKSSISGDAGACFIDRLGCPDNQGPQGHTRNDGATGRGGSAGSIAVAGVFGGVADHLMQQRPDGQPGVCDVNDAHGRLEGAATAAGLCGNSRPGPTNGLWADADWLLCRDGKWRPVEPGTFPLAPAGTFRNRVAALRGAGNAINLKAAQAFIESVM